MPLLPQKGNVPMGKVCFCVVYLKCIILFFIYFYCCSSTVVSISPHRSSQPHWPPPPTLNLTSHCSVHGSCIHVPWRPFPFFAQLSPSPLASGHFQFVLYFHVSGSILLACLFFHYIPLISDIIWYLSFTAWLISLSIILSSSIHAVVKGRNSFFLSVV